MSVAEPQARTGDGLIIRQAAGDDFAAGATVYVEAEDDLATSRRQRPRWPSAAVREAERAAAEEDLAALARHPSDLAIVAERDGRVVGVGGIIVRERHAHITYLFVRPDWQGQGIGRAVLHQLAAHAAACDLLSLHASPDPRALTRYLTLGLRPMPPTVRMSAVAPRFPALNLRDRLEAQPLRADDTALLATISDIDRAVRGVHRVDDLRSWLDAGASGALLTQRGTSIPVGYYLIAPGGHERLTGSPAAIGPVAAMDLARLPDVLARALHAAGEASSAEMPWRLDFPAENQAAVAPLLAAGFRPQRLISYLATGTIGRWDRYIFHDDDIL